MRKAFYALALISLFGCNSISLTGGESREVKFPKDLTHNYVDLGKQSPNQYEYTTQTQETATAASADANFAMWASAHIATGKSYSKTPASRIKIAALKQMGLFKASYLPDDSDVLLIQASGDFKKKNSKSGNNADDLSYSRISAIFSLTDGRTLAFSLTND